MYISGYDLFFHHYLNKVTTVFCSPWNRYSTKAFNVILGAYDRITMNMGTELRLNVVKMIPHPNFRSAHYHDVNDIGLMKLKKEVEFSPHIVPICLPQKGTPR